jgi:dipeptidyl aminopeptidase/acylaminoacyl peptidase
MTSTSRYGTWPSPVTLDALVQGAVGLSFPSVVGGEVYWSEARPAEGGRSVLVRLPLGDGGPGDAGGGNDAPKTEDVFGAGFNARTLVHEYGGLCHTFSGDAVYFSNFADQRLYRVRSGEEPAPITPEPPSPRSLRFAAPVVTPDGRHVICVRERHPEPDRPATVVNDVVVIDTAGGEPRVVLEGRDFYSHLVLSPDGRRIAWVTWDHPNMPWDGSELWVGELTADLTVTGGRQVAGGPTESVTQPKFTPSGGLVFLSDRTGWWNLYAAGTDGGPDRPLAPMEADLGAPDWVFGTSTYAVAHDGTVVATWFERGLSRLGVLHPGADGFVEIETPWTYYAQLRAADDGRAVVAVAGSPSQPLAIVRIPVPARGDERPAQPSVLKRSREQVIDAAHLSSPEPVEFPTEGGLTAHALYYGPHNPDVEPPADERPPLIVSVHGGPTGMALPVLDYGVQFWTSRGFAVAAVNYGGSSGYGRAYRERLRGKWGVVDMEDCVNAARHLAATGLVDGDRLLIHGGSAGGYTTLLVTTVTDVFAAGASYFGIADTTTFVQETHKFESHYTDGLFGPWPGTAEVYRERSPVTYTDRLRTPLILFQGLEDTIVPPDQAETMVAALRERGVPHAYVPYEGEQHGFRKSGTVRRTAEAELYFYGKVLGFAPADELEPVEIVHGDRLPI